LKITYIAVFIAILLLICLLWRLLKIKNKKRLLLLIVAFVLASISVKYVQNVTQNSLMCTIAGILVFIIFYSVVFILKNFIYRNKF